jgi:hypothetical protein
MWEEVCEVFKNQLNGDCPEREQQLIINPKFKVGDRLFKKSQFISEDDRIVYVTGIEIDEQTQTFKYYYDKESYRMPLANTWFEYCEWEEHFFRDKSHYKKVIEQKQKEFYDCM